MNSGKKAGPRRAKAGSAPAGYSGTPLAGKLGIRDGSRVHAADAPAGYRGWLQPLPEGVRFVRQPDATADVIHIFVTQRSVLAGRLRALRGTMRADAALWVSWPKRAAGVATDVTEDVVRELTLPLGLVDIKVCAVSEVWSGLKLVIRKALR